MYFLCIVTTVITIDSKQRTHHRFREHVALDALYFCLQLSTFVRSKKRMTTLFKAISTSLSQLAVGSTLCGFCLNNWSNSSGCESIRFSKISSPLFIFVILWVSPVNQASAFVLCEGKQRILITVFAPEIYQ